MHDPRDGRPTGPDGRLRWADTAKAVFIVLVVLHHTVTKHYPAVVPAGLPEAAAAWSAVTAALRPLRMPLFFLLSGLFVSRAVHRPWSQVLRHRVLRPYYVYALWLALLALFFSWATELPMNRTSTPEAYVEDLLYASTGLWYLYAACVYFVVARATRRLDAGLVIGAAALLAVSAGALSIEAFNRESLLVHLVYFLAGARVPGLVRRLGAWSGPLWQVALLVLGWGLLGAAVQQWGLPRGVTTLALSVLAVPVGVRAVVAAGEASPRLQGLATSVGRRTLPVYVLHVPVLALWHKLTLELPPLPEVPVVSALLLAAYPVLVAIGLTAACLGLHTLLARGPGRWLFELPGGRSDREPVVGSDRAPAQPR